MEAIVMRLYYEGEVNAVPARDALATHVRRSILGSGNWIMRHSSPVRLEAEERGTGNVVIFDVENVR